MAGLVAAVILFLTVSTALVFGIATAYGVLSGIIYLFGQHSVRKAPLAAQTAEEPRAMAQVAGAD